MIQARGKPTRCEVCNARKTLSWSKEANAWTCLDCHLLANIELEPLGLDYLVPSLEAAIVRGTFETFDEEAARLERTNH